MVASKEKGGLKAVDVEICKITGQRDFLADYTLKEGSDKGYEFICFWLSIDLDEADDDELFVLHQAKPFHIKGLKRALIERRLTFVIK